MRLAPQSLSPVHCRWRPKPMTTGLQCAAIPPNRCRAAGGAEPRHVRCILASADSVRRPSAGLRVVGCSERCPLRTASHLESARSSASLSHPSLSLQSVDIPSKVVLIHDPSSTIDQTPPPINHSPRSPSAGCRCDPHTTIPNAVVSSSQRHADSSVSRPRPR